MNQIAALLLMFMNDEVNIDCSLKSVFTFHISFIPFLEVANVIAHKKNF